MRKKNWKNMQMSSLLKPTVIYSYEQELIGYHCIRSENLRRELDDLWGDFKRRNLVHHGKALS